MKLLASMTVLLLLAGCGVSKSVQGRLEATKGALTYLHDSERPRTKSSQSITVRSFVVDDLIPARTTVRTVSSSMLPLLLVNTWSEEMRATLGYESLENDYKRFLRDRFHEELQRSGRFVLQEGPADLNISVHVTKAELSAPVRHSGNFFFLFFVFGGGSRYTAGPAVTTVAADVVVERKGMQVLSGVFTGKYATNILEGRNVDLGDFTIAMIEGLSLAVKDLNEKIVTAVNRLN